MDDGRVARQIGSYEPGSPRTEIISLPGNTELMGHTYRLEQQQHLIHLPHLFVQMLTIEIQDDDVIVNVVTVMAFAEAMEAAMAVEAVKVVGAEKVTDISIGTTTKVRPVSPVSSPTSPATAVELMSTISITNA